MRVPVANDPCLELFMNNNEKDDGRFHAGTEL